MRCARLPPDGERLPKKLRKITMKFDTLADAERGYAKLHSEFETLLGMVAGITTILSSVIAKHPNYDQFQLHLTSLVELAENGALGKSLNSRQKEVARTYVEQLQLIQEVRGDIRPLDQSGNQAG